MKRKIFMDPNVPKNIPKSTNSLYWDGASDVMTIEIWFKNLIRADSIEELREITIPKEDKTSRKKITWEITQNHTGLSNYLHMTQAGPSFLKPRRN